MLPAICGIRLESHHVNTQEIRSSVALKVGEVGHISYPLLWRGPISQRWIQSKERACIHISPPSSFFFVKISNDCSFQIFTSTQTNINCVSGIQVFWTLVN
jgi:hypothetical protein